MSDAYSPHKAVRHLDVLQAMRDPAARPVRPAHVQVILSDLCDAACDFCAYRDPTYSASQKFFEIKPQGAALRRDAEHPERNFNPNRMIPYEKAIEILDDCQVMGVSGIQFTGGGEPTIHPKFFDVLQYAQEKNLETSIVTNGVTIGRKAENHPILIGQLLGHLAWSRVSIDAGCAEDYARIRHVPIGHWNHAWYAVGALREASDRVGARDRRHPPVVGVGFVVTQDNWSGVYEACRLAKKHGAHNIRISAQFSNEDEHRFASFAEQCAKLCEAAARELSDDTFTVYNRFSAKLEDLRQRSPDYQRCGYQEMTTYIGGDLNVYRCCVTSYNDQGLLGSIKERRFKDLWMSPERVADQRAFDARGCERCQFNGINRFLDYATRAEDPEHSEFV